MFKINAFLNFLFIKLYWKTVKVLFNNNIIIDIISTTILSSTTVFNIDNNKLT